MKQEASSYRDPEGYIVYSDDKIYRCVTDLNAAILQKDYKAFFEEAVKQELLVPFYFTKKDQGNSKTKLLELSRVPFISYPYEWGFVQLKEAALLTLDICLLALEHGLTLKDATAFNVQQVNGKMIFIDHTSFEKTDGNLPWLPYSQFCRHFLAPLLITSHTGHNGNKGFRTSLDGLELSETSYILPLRTRLKPALLLHIYMHNFLIKGNKHKNAPDQKDHVKTARHAYQKNKPNSGIQKAYLEHLKKVIEKIKPPKYDTEWYDYYNNTNYNDKTFEEKEAFVEKIASSKDYKCAWDIGGNNGHFSRILSKSINSIISMDIDYAAVDLNYSKNRKEKITNITPIVFDMSNPSPSVGFANAERPRLEERSQPDLIVMLAVIHHLSVTYNIPFKILASYLSKLKADLLIEYVDREDSQFQKLLKNKSDEYPEYTQNHFEEAFLEYFDLVEKTSITNAARVLYLLRPKPKR